MVLSRCWVRIPARARGLVRHAALDDESCPASGFKQPQFAELEGVSFMTVRVRDWRYDVIALGAVAVLLTVVFSVTSLDIAAARLFYSPQPLDHWPLASKAPWSVLYQMASWITGALLLSGLAALGVGLLRRNASARRYGVFILLAVALGPGLIVNAICKDHWDRPRPRDIVQFGGAAHYVAAPLPGEGGASFPCGHCSVAFLCAAGWWIWRQRRPYLAAASLATGLIGGAAMGICRMSAGAHFLSDVLWSALIVLGVAHLLYHYVLRIPVYEAIDQGVLTAQAPGTRPLWQKVLTACGALLVLAALLATPHSIQLADEIQLAPRPPRILEVTARTANVEVILTDSPATLAEVSGELHGFGLVTDRIRAHAQLDAAPTATLRYEVQQSGWFIGLDGAVTVRMPAAELQRVTVHINRGTIKVTDTTRDGAASSGKLCLDLQTAAGRVLESPPERFAGVANCRGPFQARRAALPPPGATSGNAGPRLQATPGSS